MKSWFSIFCLLLGLCIALPGNSQVVVSTGTGLATSSNTQIAITDDLTINSDNADLSKVLLSLFGSSQDLRISRANSTLVLGGLIVGQPGGGNGGNKSLFGGTWEIAGSLVFNDGVIVPQTGSNGRLVHAIPVASLGDVQVNDPASYLNGTFYSRGTGVRVFPIGNGSGYYPAILSSVSQGDVEIGMQVVNSNAGLTHDSDILNIFEDQYWQIVDAPSLTGPIVSVSTLGAGFYLDPNIGTVILGGPATSQAGRALGGAPNGDYMVSSKSITTNERIFTLAKVSDGSPLIKLKIHNVVTPFKDNANDYIQIENIHLFPKNKVRLLDRWGSLVKEWNGFVNADNSNPDSSYDLSKVATGNYIVILEYTDGSSQKELSQMVTIINQ